MNYKRYKTISCLTHNEHCITHNDGSGLKVQSSGTETNKKSSALRPTVHYPHSGAAYSDYIKKHQEISSRIK